MVDQVKFMSLALDLARKGLGRTSPNPPVGAVIVKKGKILGTGFHRKAGLSHAETEAISSVGAQNFEPLQNATLYVTLEPCCHHGRTPPCTDAIIQSGIREVVIGMRDPDPKVSGKGIKILRKAGIKVRSGVLRQECEKIYEAYIKHRLTGMPFVTLKAAMTLDGMVATSKGESKWITGSEAREQVHEMRDKTDAILVGIGTILKDDPQLTTRLHRKKGKDPIRIVLDSSLRIQPNARILKVHSKSPTWIATTVKPTHSTVAILKKMGTEILFCRQDREGRVDLIDLLRKLGQRGVVSLMIEGGPTVHSTFVRKGLADKMILFVAPFFLGGEAMPLFKGLELKSLNQKLALKGVSLSPIGEDWMVEGYLNIKSTLS